MNIKKNFIRSFIVLLIPCFLGLIAQPFREDGYENIVATLSFPSSLIVYFVYNPIPHDGFIEIPYWIRCLIITLNAFLQYFYFFLLFSLKKQSTATFKNFFILWSFWVVCFLLLIFFGLILNMCLQN